MLTIYCWARQRPRPFGITVAILLAVGVSALAFFSSGPRATFSTGPVFGLALSQDGGTIAMATARGPSLWDAKTGKELLLLEGHESSVDFVGFGPDDRSLITFGPRKVEAESIAYVWDISKFMAQRMTPRTGTLEREIWNSSNRDGVVTLSIDDQAFNAAISPGRRWFAVLGNGGHVKIYDLKKAKPALHADFRAHAGLAEFRPEQIAFGTDDVLATAGQDRFIPRNGLPEGGPTSVKLWDLSDNHLLRVLKSGPGETAGGLTFFPSGKALAVAYTRLEGRGAVAIWDLEHDSTPPKRIEVEPSSTCVSPDGRLLAVGERDGSVSLWDVASLKKTHRFSGHERAVRAMLYSRDGKTLYSAGVDGVKVWNVGVP
jgi:WD40 repeat protein